MVLDETHQLVLVIETSGKVQSNAFRVVVFEPVVEALIVTIIESDLLQFPFQVPIGFRHKKHIGMLQPHGGDYLAPVLFGRGSAHTPSPRLLKDVVEQQHRHIAAHPVALLSDRIQCLDDRLAQRWTEGVELCHILPRRKVRVAPVGNHRSARLKKCTWSLSQVFACSLHKECRVLENPWMIRRHMVGHKIQNQAQTALREHLPRYGKSIRSAEVFIHNVPVHTISRADIIGRGIVRQCAVEIGLQCRVFVGNAHSLRASLPYAHQPHGVHVERGKFIPLFRRNSAQCDGALVLPAQFIEPHPCIDLVDDWPCWPRCFHAIFIVHTGLPPGGIAFTNTHSILNQLID